MTDKSKDKTEFEKTRDAANEADMSSSKALQNDALTSVSGVKASVESLNKVRKLRGDK